MAASKQQTIYLRLEIRTRLFCVCQPLNREPDLSFVIGAVEKMIPHMRQGQIVSLESTTYPGTTEEVIRPLLEAQNFIIGENCFLVYSPEREDPANPNYSTTSIPKVLEEYLFARTLE